MRERLGASVHFALTKVGGEAYCCCVGKTILAPSFPAASVNGPVALFALERGALGVTCKEAGGVLQAPAARGAQVIEDLVESGVLSATAESRDGRQVYVHVYSVAGIPAEYFFDNETAARSQAPTERPGRK